RISPPATAPASQSIAVQPVRASKSEAWPTRMPGMSVRPFMRPQAEACATAHVSIVGIGGYPLDLAKRIVGAFQDFVLLGIRAIGNVFRSPHYADDVFIQMDTIGVGSLPIVVLIGFFSGAVMAMQMSRALAVYGAQGQIGKIVSITLVR